MKTDTKQSSKEETGRGSLHRLVGLIPCPKCGAGQHPPIQSDGKRAWWNCGSYGIGEVDRQSDVCAEREEHNETKRENARLRDGLREMRDLIRAMNFGDTFPRIARSLQNADNLISPNAKLSGSPTESNE